VDLWCSCPDNQFWLPNSPFQLFGSSVIPSWQRGLEIRSRAKGDNHGCPHPPGFLPPRDQVTAARV